MFLPLGPEKDGLSRMPWITLGYMALLVSAYLAHRFMPGDMEPIHRALRHYASYPHLALEGPLRTIMEANDRYTRSQPTAFYTDDEIATQQARLDALAEEAYVALDKLTVTRVGFNPTAIDPAALLTGQFLTPSFGLLLGQLIFLYLCAFYVEDRWGRPFFAMLLLGGGAVAALAMVPFGSWMILTGAGGSTAAAIGAYTVRFYRDKVRLLFTTPWQSSEERYVNPIVLFPIWQIGQLAFTFFAGHPLGQHNLVYVSQWFGFGFGAAVAFVIRALQVEPRLYQTEYDRQPEPDRIRVETARMLRLGSAKDALARLAYAHRQYPDDFEFLEQYWTQAARMNRAHEAADAGRRLIARCLDHDKLGDAFFYWREFRRNLPNEPIDPPLAHALAETLLNLGDRGDAESVIDDLTENPPSDWRGEDWTKLVSIAEFIDPNRCMLLIDRVLADAALDEETKTTLRRAYDELKTLHGDPSQETPVEAIEISPLAPKPEIAAAEAEDPFAPTRIAALARTEALPVSMSARELALQVGDVSQRLALDRISAVAVGAIREIGGSPFLLLDLLMDDPLEELPRHRMIRLHSRRFDPRRLVGGEDSPAQAMRQLVQRLLASSEATPLPDEEALTGHRFPVYGSIEEFERRTYGV